VNFREVNPYYSPLLYFIGKNLQAMAFRMIWRRKVRGLENVPPFGTPVIFAANHRSLTDPSNVGSSLPYPIFYFAKEELFQVPFIGWYIRRVNSFPVRRKEHDVGAFKTAIDVLDHGGGLMFFLKGEGVWILKSNGKPNPVSGCSPARPGRRSSPWGSKMPTG